MTSRILGLFGRDDALRLAMAENLWPSGPDNLVQEKKDPADLRGTGGVEWWHRPVLSGGGGARR